MRAIISVVEREGLAELARELQSHDVAIFAVGGTQKALKTLKIEAHPLAELSGSSPPHDGRVDALHPLVLGSILASHEPIRHKGAAHSQRTEPIDLVVVNFPPVSRSLVDEMERVEIAGSALIRAAASNFRNVIVLVHPADYAPVMQEWREQGEVSLETRRRLAVTALQYVASYDSVLAAYLRSATGELFPEYLTLPLRCVRPLRYGENPHQQAALYRWNAPTVTTPTLAGAHQVGGKDPSFNNLLDLDVALGTVQCFTASTVVIVRHTNPCGLACDDNLLEAYRKAHSGDPIPASGGVIGCNRQLDEGMAQEISQLFYEAIIAPDFSPAALAIFRGRKDLCLFATHSAIEPVAANTHALPMAPPEVRSVSGGVLLQTPDIQSEREAEYEVVTEREPNLEEVTDLMFAWKAVCRVKSNAIVLAHKLTLIGVGAGQVNRATSVQLALEKADTRARGSVLASDAAFPFADGIEAAARGGITAIIQPGGSLRDEEAIRVANRYAIAMIFTGRRHFRH